MFVDGDANILHADLDAFYASVEQRDDPALRGRPVIVGGGVVLAASYEAKAYGVRTAMGGRQAQRLCPHAVVVPPRFSAYSDASKAVFDVFRDTTPLVEGLSIDEAFLDVGGLWRIAGTPVVIATELRRRGAGPRSVWPSPSASPAPSSWPRWPAAWPNPTGCCSSSPDGELGFLHPLPVERLWGVGPATAEKLHARGISTVGEVAALGEGPLVAILGGGVRTPPPCARAQPRPPPRGRRSSAPVGGIPAGDGPGTSLGRVESTPPSSRSPIA